MAVLAYPLAGRSANALAAAGCYRHIVFIRRAIAILVDAVTIGISTCGWTGLTGIRELTVHGREGGGSLFRMKIPSLSEADAAGASPTGGPLEE